MKKRKRILSLSLAFLITFSGIPNVAYASENAPVLTATPNGEGDYIHLEWNMEDKSKEYTYMVYKKTEGEDEFQTIPVKDTVKVLEVYPYISVLKDWTDAYGLGKITTHSVSSEAFNSNPSQVWDYDVVVLGFADNNNKQSLSDSARIEIEKFVEQGRGLLLGHDTIYPDITRNNYVILATKYLNMNANLTGNWYNGVTERSDTGVGGTSAILITKKGFLTNYPHKIGDVGDVLIVPYGHTSYQFAKGDIWMRFDHKNQTDPYNFYLTTWNNVAMAQTGHSIREDNNSTEWATEDEQKLIVNTLFYLAQITDKTSLNDHTGQDITAPTKPTIEDVKIIDGSSIQVRYSESEDKGTKYQYYVEATTENNKISSTIVEDTIKSGLKGYSIVVDNSPNTIPDNTIETTFTNYTLNELISSDFYVHIVSVDNAGNVSDVAHYKYTDNLAPTLTLNQEMLNMTNEDILITASAEDSDTGVREIVLPDGTVVKGKTASYKAPANGTYTFKAIDYFGNEVSESIVVSNIDKTAPNLVLSQDVSEITNKDIILTAIAEDLGSGVKEIILPNGDRVSSSTATYVVSENGTYEFKAIDNTGNEATKSIAVANIDKIKPTITIEPYDTEWTNQDIVVKARVDKGTLNRESYTFTENDSFEFIATDGAGNVTKEIVTITNIDKISPTAPSIKRVEDELVLIPATDNLSGISKYIYSIDNSNWIEFKKNINIDDLTPGSHNIKIKAIDNANNESEVFELDFFVENKALIEAINAVEKAELLLDEEDYDKAIRLINNLPDSEENNREKIDLLNRLEAIRPQVELNTKVKQIENIIDELDDLSYSNLIEIEDLIDTITDKSITNRLKNLLDNRVVIVQEENIEKSEDMINNLGDYFTAEDMRDIYSTIDKLQEGKEKSSLQQTLKAVISKKTLDLASNGMEKDTARAIDLAENLKREPYISQANAKIALLEENNLKEVLEERLVILDMSLNQDSKINVKNAIYYVRMAEELNREPHMSKARMVVDLLNPSDFKVELLLRVEAIRGELSEEEKAIIVATNYVEKAEKYQYSLVLRQAIEKVQRLKESDAKISLLERLNILINN